MIILIMIIITVMMIAADIIDIGIIITSSSRTTQPWTVYDSSLYCERLSAEVILRLEAK